MKSGLLRARPSTCPACRPRQAGLTLVELMISLVLGMLVVAAAILLLLSSKSSFTIEDDTSRLLDAGRFAIENISRSVRQTGYEALGGETVPIVSQPTDAPNIRGFDDATLAASGGLPPTPIPEPGHHSDILQLRYFGNPDGSIVNCAGIQVPEVFSVADTYDKRGWSTYFVRQVPGGEPELACRYRDTGNQVQSVALASGVESFQVLYGIDRNDDGIPDRFLSATELDQDLLAGLPDTRDSLWKKVVAVKVALLLRGARTQRADAPNITYDLFGANYTIGADLGTRFHEDDPSLPADERSRTRKVFSTTIQLRNRAAGANVAALP